MALPPSKWSALRYGFEPEEDRDGEEGAQARGDRGQAAAGGCPGVAGTDGGGGDPRDRRDGSDLLPVAAGVRGPEVGPSEAAEGAGSGEHAAAQGGGGPDLGQADPGGGRTGKPLLYSGRMAQLLIRCCLPEWMNGPAAHPSPHFSAARAG